MDQPNCNQDLDISPPSASIDQSLQDTETISSTNGTATLNNPDDFSLTTSPIPELEETFEPSENYQHSNVGLSNQQSFDSGEPDIKSSEQSKRNSTDSACSTTERIVPIMNVRSTVKDELKQVPTLRRTSSGYVPFSMEKKNTPLFGSHEALSSASQLKNKKPPVSLAVRRKSVDKPPSIPKTSQQRKPLITPPNRTEKGIVTESKNLAKIEAKVDSIRKQPLKPHSQIVEAVTHRLYAKSKKKEMGTNTEAQNSKQNPKELSICSNARMRLRELTRKAVRANRFKDQITQTELFPVLRVKETSTDISDLTVLSQEVKDAETNIASPEMQDIGVNCTSLDSFSQLPTENSTKVLVVTRSCSTQVEEEYLKNNNDQEIKEPATEPNPRTISFTKYLREKNQSKQEILDTMLPNPIYTNTVNINISHNYVNGRRILDSNASEDSLDEEAQQNINLPTPDLISNHNSLEPFTLGGQEVNQATKIQSVDTQIKYPVALVEQYQIYTTEELKTTTPDNFIANCVSIPDYSRKLTSIAIPSVYVAEICIVPNKQDRCFPFPTFTPETARPKISDYESFKCDDCITIKEPLLLKSIMKHIPILPQNYKREEERLQSDDTSDDSIRSVEIPDSLDYHIANAKKVRFSKNKKGKNDKMLVVMSQFFSEATELMNNLTTAANRLDQAIPDSFDLEVSISDISGIKSHLCDNHKKKRKKQIQRCSRKTEYSQTDETPAEDECCQTIPTLLLDSSTQYDCSIPPNKYEPLLEDSCKRLEEKLNFKLSSAPVADDLSDACFDDDRLDPNYRDIGYNPWDLSVLKQNDFSSLESNPVTFSDYGSLPRKYPKRHRTSSCSPSAFLRQLTNMRRQVVESSREDLLK